VKARKRARCGVLRHSASLQTNAQCVELQKHEGPPPVDGGPRVHMITGSLHFLMRAGVIFLRLGQIALWVLHEVGLGLLTAKAVGLALKGRVN
jgi:hypothetical protein